MSGEFEGLGADSDDAPGDGLPGGDAQPSGEPDWAQAQAATAVDQFGNCNYCGFQGECMAPGPSCGIAKSRMAQKSAAPVAPSPSVTNPVSAAPEPHDEGGVWVTYKCDVPEWDRNHDPVTEVTLHRSELEALRHAMASQQQAKFLGWGEEL